MADTPDEPVKLEAPLYVDADGEPASSGTALYRRGDRIHPNEARRFGVHPSQRGRQQGANRQKPQGQNRSAGAQPVQTEAPAD